MLTDVGAVDLTVPRDRNGSFEPQIVRKGQTRLDGFNDRIVALYARGLTTRDIRAHLREMYDVDVSPDLISRVTDGVLEELAEWGGRDRHGQPAQSRGHAVPDLGVAQLGEQAPRRQQVDNYAGRKITDAALDPARFLQHRVDHLERHLLRQLAQVPRREAASGHSHGTRNDRLIHGGAPGDEAVFRGQTSLTESRCHRTNRHTLTARQLA